MAIQVQYRRGTSAENDAFTGAVGEITVDTTAQTLRIHDGSTAGGSNIATTQYVVDSIGNISGSAIENGSSNVQIASSGGNVVSTVNGSTVSTLADSGLELTGNLDVTGNISVTSALDAGTVTTTGAIGSGSTVTATGNVTGGNLVTAGDATVATITASGNIDSAGNIEGSFLLGNGFFISGLPASYGNTNVEDFLPTYTGNLVSLTDDVITTANVDAANFNATANVDAVNVNVTDVNATNLTGTLNTASQTNITAVGTLASGSIASGFGAIDIGANNLTVGNIIAGAGNAVGNIGSVSDQFNTVHALATSAQYADLAEIYSADAEYEPGTVVRIGGDAEVTQTTDHADTEVFGVISTQPAYLMNNNAVGVPVALQGRVPCKVIGKVRKGERLVSSDVPGVAWALGNDEYDARAVIGRALVDKTDGDQGLVEITVGTR